MNNFIQRFRDPLAWAYGLVSGCLIGGATALINYMSIGSDMQAIDWKKLGTLFAVNFLFSAMLYLKQSPLPPLEDKNASS